MLIQWNGDAVVAWAPAKVNFFLEVHAKRADGYHEISTLMATVSLFDTLTFARSDSGDFDLQCDTPVLSSGPENLVIRAARLLKEETRFPQGARITLSKKIPMAAGLAGGSANAAATLVGLNALWGLDLAADRLATLAARIGSDVSFFTTASAAWCTGRGEKVEVLRPHPGFWLVLACPAAGLSTAAVYANVRVPPNPVSGAAMREAFESADVEAVGRLVHNRLESAALALCPALGRVREILMSTGSAGVAMSGSGSTWFALCRSHREALHVAGRLCQWKTEEPPLRIFVVRTCP